jgi:hypothetical protein
MRYSVDTRHQRVDERPERLNKYTITQGNRESYLLAAVVKFGYMLEQLSICRYRVMQSLGENPCSAANQQERLPMIMLEESSETTCQTHCILSGEDIVRSAWRHAANKMPKVAKFLVG